jgi:hypothetical protein
MELYQVQQLWPQGRRDEQKWRVVAATNEDEAAYKVTGERLSRDGDRRRARLRVMRLGTGSPPPTIFYAA